MAEGAFGVVVWLLGFLILIRGQTQVSLDVDTLLDTAEGCLRFVTETRGVVPKWKRLEQFDPTSREYPLLLNSILENPADRRSTAALEGGGAAIVLDILARVRDHQPTRVGYEPASIS